MSRNLKITLIAFVVPLVLPILELFVLFIPYFYVVIFHGVSISEVFREYNQNLSVLAIAIPSAINSVLLYMYLGRAQNNISKLNFFPVVTAFIVGILCSVALGIYASFMGSDYRVVIREAVVIYGPALFMGVLVYDYIIVLILRRLSKKSPDAGITQPPLQTIQPPPTTPQP
ncbi:MAG: hypothetical protein CEN90_439 [Parcubacteria group bacterium Licking1014_17]|nr:MAG: hypothetical protein CEN90_439 [Parcubacteria group bacterium Licking1014_17]